MKENMFGESTSKELKILTSMDVLNLNNNKEIDDKRDDYGNDKSKDTFRSEIENKEEIKNIEN